jgi:hypothetical protein
MYMYLHVLTVSSVVVASNIVEGYYQFLTNLLALEYQANQTMVPEVKGFLPMAAWERFFRPMPDQQLAQFI